VGEKASGSFETDKKEHTQFKWEAVFQLKCCDAAAPK
jgi:hypothetical protein